MGKWNDMLYDKLAKRPVKKDIQCTFGRDAGSFEEDTEIL